MKNISLTLLFLAFFVLQLVGADPSTEYELGRRLDFWLEQYSLNSKRAILVQAGVEIADPSSLNGKISPPSQINTFPKEFEKALLETHGIELILFRDDLAICQWTDQKEFFPARDEAKRQLEMIGLPENKIPKRVIVTDSLTLKVASKD